MPSYEDMKEKKLWQFIQNYKPQYITKEKFDAGKKDKGNYIFTKNEIMQEIGWKNGTFYNRLKSIESGSFEELTMTQNLYIKKREAGDKTEKLLFSYNSLVAFLSIYFILDLNYQESVNNNQDSVNKESNTEKVDTILTDNETDSKENAEIKRFYESLLKEKDARIEDLQKQIEDLIEQKNELTTIIKYKEEKDTNLTKLEVMTKQNQILLNDAEGNKKQSLFSKFFNFRKRNKDIEE